MLSDPVDQDFSDAENHCDAIAPVGVTGRQFLESLLFTGSYHQGPCARSAD